MKIGLQTWGSEGDIQPFLALSAGLARAGHSVTLAVTDNIGRDYSSVADSSGFQLVPLPSPKFTSDQAAFAIWQRIIQLGNPLRQVELILKHAFDPLVDSMHAAAKKLCTDNDALVGHFFVHPLRVAAEKAGKPIASLNVVHNCIPSRAISPPGLPDLGQWSYPLGSRITRAVVNHIFLPRINRLRRHEGLSPHSDVMTQSWAADRLNLIAVSQRFCQAPADWQPRHQVCGFLNPPTPGDSIDLPPEMEKFLTQGPPPVYFTFGGMMFNHTAYLSEVAAIWVEAVRSVGCRAILQLPWGDWPQYAADPGILIVGRSPYSKVFPLCSLVVHHGGSGTTQSALLAGRPSVVVAHLADQFFWGSELQRLGSAGKALARKNLTPIKLAAAIRRLLDDPDFPVNASRLGTSMRSEDGVSTAVQLIEKNLLASRSVIPRGS